MGRGLVSLWKQLPHDGWNPAILEGSVLKAEKGLPGRPLEIIKRLVPL